MNYVFAFLAVILVIFAARFLSAPPQKPPAQEPSTSVAEGLFAPTQSDASKRIQEMKEQQERMLQEQKKMQQQRLDTYNQ